MFSLSFHLITAPLPLFPRPPRPVHLIKFRFHTVDSQISANLLITSTPNPPHPNPSRAIFIKKRKKRGKKFRPKQTVRNRKPPHLGDRKREKAAQKEKNIFLNRSSRYFATYLVPSPSLRPPGRWPTSSNVAFHTSRRGNALSRLQVASIRSLRVLIAYSASNRGSRPVNDGRPCSRWSLLEVPLG